ncbi:LysR family transcriptional regulator [Pseudomonas sp. PA-6-3C]|nr:MULTISPECIES: LysR family transcriptional regulator [unclassified Pseudomonas]MCF5143867.1 LysR family transcriptional regulator [Pseudomonas sp. PA-6-3C]MCF5150960.1 LysR family transcriptional regulator [Pseudomonas sp. PA-6-3F]MCF5159000.1 LysR family transcriptional regulator [Pseudomonas sp. PA-6-2E]MCF5195966.1 LysR family transcriptional regulator [Pseudomonas sp. PA-6-1H]
MHDHKTPSFHRLDLNLLRVFDAVYQDRSILLASKRLNVTNSAVSHALGRLRESLSDELFIRTSRGMEPSIRAEAIASSIRQALDLIQNTLVVESFDPGTSSRTFTIAATDYVTSVLISRLLTHLSGIAPGVKLVIRPSTRLDLAEQIDIGRIDLVIGSFAELPRRVQSTMLWEQQDVLLMRSGHPLLTHTPITLKSLKCYSMVIVSVGGQEEGAVNGYISERGLARQSEMFDRQSLEQALATIRQSPNYGLTLPHALALPDILSSTNLVGIVPEYLAHSFQKKFSLCYRPLPYSAPPSILQAVWHARNEGDQGHIWLRRQLIILAKQYMESVKFCKI